MKKPLKNLWKQDRHLNNSKHRNFSPILSQDGKKVTRILSDTSSKNLWNKSEIRFNEFHSHSKDKQSYQDYSYLVYENEKLKEEIKSLQQFIANDNNWGKVYDRAGLEAKQKQEDMEKQLNRLKKVLEKSYYSIRKMQVQIQQLTSSLQKAQKNCQNLGKKLRVVELQREQNSRKLSSTISIHKKQIQIFNSRIHSLENNIEQLIVLMEHDNEEWRKHMRELNNFKTFYLQRTSYK